MAYSDAQRIAALTVLAANKNDYKKAAELTGISTATLQRWNQSTEERKDLGMLLDEAITKMFSLMPSKWDGRDWGIALGILLDKSLLMQGQATEITEHIGDYRLTEAEKEIVAERARAIVSGYSDDGAGSGSDNGPDPA